MRPTAKAPRIPPETFVVAWVAASIAVAGLAANAIRPRTEPRATIIDRIHITKSRHRLEALAGTFRVASCRVSIGRGGGGPKRFDGDRRTPEGTYTIDARHPSARFHRFLHVSYPNDADRHTFERGVAAGSIPTGATIGGEIGIHGSGGGLARWFGALVDWTSGCIAVRNDEIDVLYERVRPGAVVVIDP